MKLRPLPASSVHSHCKVVSLLFGHSLGQGLKVIRIPLHHVSSLRKVPGLVVHAPNPVLDMRQLSFNVVFKPPMLT